MIAKINFEKILLIYIFFLLSDNIYLIIIFLTLLKQKQTFKFNELNVENTIAFALHKKSIIYKNLRKIRNK